MEPYDSPDEAEFRRQARSWLGANAASLSGPPISPSAIVAEWTPEQEGERFSRAIDWQRRKFDAGWAGVAWPTQYGGRGGTPIQSIIFDEEESRFDLPRDALAVGIGWCGPALLVHGTDEQRSRFLPPLLRGDEVWCQLFSEPGAGSDLAGLRTKAVRDGDEWLLSGQKVWTTFAHRSRWGLCVARTDPDLPKHHGLTAFLVDMGDPGVRCRPLVQMTGASNFNEVFLDEVRVPDERRLAEVGEGWRVVITTFMFERVGVLFDTDGLVAAVRRLVVEKGLAADRRIRDRLMRAEIGTRLLHYQKLRLLTELSHGRLPGPEGSVLKLAATHFLTEVYDLALEVLGAAGSLDGADAPDGAEWQAAFLGTPGLRVGGGTDEVQRNIIGERVLGLPADLRPDKDAPFSAMRD